MAELTFYKAKYIVDYYGNFLDKNRALGWIKPKCVVRISMTIDFLTPFHKLDAYEGDSPYVEILSIEKDGTIFGKILAHDRRDTDDHYPLRTGERVKFNKIHIFEIPIDLQPQELQKFFKKCIVKRKDKILATGPINLVEYEVDYGSSSEDESECNNLSEEEKWVVQ